MKLRTGEALTYSELQSYCDLVGISLSPFEVHAIMAMDKEANAVISEIISDQSVEVEDSDGGA